MWKNFWLFNKVKGLTYSTFSIEGLNVEFLLNRLKKNGVNVYNVKRITAKKTIITVPYNHTKKFFAISKELCYNVKKVKSGGRYYPFIRFISSISVVLGILFFSLFTYFSSNLVYTISFYGSGAKHQVAVKEYFSEIGVKKFSSFKSINLKELSKDIVLSVSDVAFAECVRRGGELKVYLVENVKDVGINTLAENLVCSVNGVIESLSVYRGTPLKKVGDNVIDGETLVVGEEQANGKVIKTGVLAYVKIRAEKTFTFYDESDNKKETFLALAINLTKESPINYDISIEKINEQYLYTIKIEYVKEIYSGL